jgi:hypothetical protein
MDVITVMQVIGLQLYGIKRVMSELKEKWKRDIKSQDNVRKSESQALDVNEQKKKNGTQNSSKLLVGRVVNWATKQPIATVKGSQMTRTKICICCNKNVIVATKLDIWHTSVPKKIKKLTSSFS